ncbi:MAG: TIGR00730 family Rossman fold protein [Rhodanobacter sp.]
MPQPTSLCVYCGSSTGGHADYTELAHEFGTEMARRHITLVYGGGKVGLMGVLADAVLAGGGKVIGVIPRQLVDLEVAHSGVDLHVVDTMHQRKTRMFELAEGFVALPGGFGTMDEIFEMLTWAQLGLHRFPCAFLQTHGYYQQLQGMIEHMAKEQFITHGQLESIWFGQSIPTLFAWMVQYDGGNAARVLGPASIKA